jgi:hypothetical protein
MGLQSEGCTATLCHMQKVEWTPRLFLLTCALAVGVVGQAAPDATAPAGDAGADDASIEDASPNGDGCVLPTTLSEEGGPTPEQIPGPPSNDGSLDDGYAPPFTMDNGDALLYLGICQTLPTPFSYTSVKTPYTDAAGCMAFANQGHPAVHNCLCTKCFTLIQECDSLPNCQAIVKCAWDTGCTNSTACYLSPVATCVTPINNAGTGSVATGLSNSIQTCITSNSCPTK